MLMVLLPLTIVGMTDADPVDRDIVFIVSDWANADTCAGEART